MLALGENCVLTMPVILRSPCGSREAQQSLAHANSKVMHLAQWPTDKSK